MVWRELGESVTIRCRADGLKPDMLSLKRGLRRSDVFARSNQSRPTISTEMKNRLEHKGVFPSLDLVIFNLTVEDTGPYWCEYVTFDENMKHQDGNGTVLLVVKGEPALQSTPNISLVNSDPVLGVWY